MTEANLSRCILLFTSDGAGIKLLRYNYTGVSLTQKNRLKFL